MPDQSNMPEIIDGGLDLGFELQFRWGRDQYLQWVREGAAVWRRQENQEFGTEWGSIYIAYW